MGDVVLTPPGQGRLFPVDPTSERLAVLSPDGQLIVRTSELAAAVIAVSAEPTGGWLVAPDRWSARLTPAEDGWQVDAVGPAPIDAIRRVLALIASKEDLS